MPGDLSLPRDVAAIPVDVERAPFPFVDPLQAHRGLREWLGEERVYLLESLAGPEIDNRISLIGVNPLFTVSVSGLDVDLSGVGSVVDMAMRAALGSGALAETGSQLVLASRGSPWDLLRALRACFRLSPDPDPGTYSFGFFGFFGYDAVRYIETLPETIPDTSELPDILLSVYQATLQFDLVKRTAALVHGNSDRWEPLPLERLTQAVTAPPPAGAAPAPPPAPRSVTDSIAAPDYKDRVSTALHHIGIGDIYQVQLGHEILIESDVAPLDVYLRLRDRNPSPYMYYAPLGGSVIIGASPEVFLRLEDGLLTMRPIAGTAPRGASEAEDRAAVEALSNDPKEVAEHIMLVDLCRNDIGRVCVPGSLDVTELLIVERYSHVFHLVSNVVGRLSETFDVYDAIRATFSAGTMVGAPKVRAMEIIEDLETSRRGVYAGMIGLIDFGGYANTALCIRTTEHRNGTYRLRASAGVVADSRPDKEWRETLVKMGAVYWAVVGKELAP